MDRRPAPPGRRDAGTVAPRTQLAAMAARVSASAVAATPARSATLASGRPNSAAPSARSLVQQGQIAVLADSLWPP